MTRGDTGRGVGGVPTFGYRTPGGEQPCFICLIFACSLRQEVGTRIVVHTSLKEVFSAISL